MRLGRTVVKYKGKDVTKETFALLRKRRAGKLGDANTTLLIHMLGYSPQQAAKLVQSIALKAWEEARHPREAAGGPGGGEFTSGSASVFDPKQFKTLEDADGDPTKTADKLMARWEVTAGKAYDKEAMSRIDQYIVAGGEEVNKYLRGEEVSPEAFLPSKGLSEDGTDTPPTFTSLDELKTFVDKFDGDFSKMTLGENVQLYRGVSHFEAEGLVRQIEADPKSMIGMTFNTPAYLSTSTSSGNAEQFAEGVSSTKVFSPVATQAQIDEMAANPLVPRGPGATQQSLSPEGTPWSEYTAREYTNAIVRDSGKPMQAAVLLRVMAPADQPVVYVDAEKHVAPDGGENEIVFPRNTTFQVEKVTHRDGGDGRRYYLWVRVVSPIQKGDLPGHEFHGNQYGLYHHTTPDAAKSIREGGFHLSDNSMYGKGVYFTSSTDSRAGRPATVEAELAPHKELFVPDDTDVSSRVREITGVDTFDPSYREKMLEAGYGSIRFPVDNEMWTNVLDPKLIKVKKGDLPGHPFHGNQWTGGLTGKDNESSVLVHRLVEKRTGEATKLHSGNDLKYVKRIVDAKMEQVVKKYPGLADMPIRINAHTPTEGNNGHTSYFEKSAPIMTLSAMGGSKMMQLGSTELILAEEGKARWSVNAADRMAFNRDKTVEGTFMHELGHNIAYYANQEDPNFYRDVVHDAVTDAKLNNGSALAKMVSQYATVHEHEMVAELFAMVNRSDYKPGTLPPDLENIPKEMVEKAIEYFRRHKKADSAREHLHSQPTLTAKQVTAIAAAIDKAGLFTGPDFMTKVGGYASLLRKD